jgi:hypothetical protein
MKESGGVYQAEATQEQSPQGQRLRTNYFASDYFHSTARAEVAVLIIFPGYFSRLWSHGGYRQSKHGCDRSKATGK